MLRSKFYVCPICGNVIHSTGEGCFSCCGINLPMAEAEEPDEKHMIKAERMENDWYISVDHPMTKEHYISFIAYITSSKTQLVKLYPEQNAETRLTSCGHGIIYAYCSTHGLFSIRV